MQEIKDGCHSCLELNKNVIVAVYPKNYIPELKDHAIRGAVMTTGILVSTFVVKKVKKDMPPDLTTKSSVSLFTVVVLSCYLIDYLQRYQYIPYNV